MTTQMIEEKLWDLSMEISKLKAENKLLKSVNDSLIQALHKPVIVREGDKEENTSAKHGSMLLNPIITNTLNTPTEPLATEARDTVAAGGHIHKWHDVDGKEWVCYMCGKSKTDERKSSEGQP